MVQPKGRKVQPAPFSTASAKKKAKAPSHPLFLSTPKKFGIGQCPRPKPDLTRYVRWPRYIRLQRQRRVLLQRLKVPPAINQFSAAIDRNQATQLFKLLNKYKVEPETEKKARLVEEARKRAAGEAPTDKKRRLAVTHGIQSVTHLVEAGRAKMVVIAHDVEPVDLVCWLPALCRKKDVPYCVVKSKARLGQLCERHTTSCVALENVRKEDQVDFDNLCKLFRAEFNDNVDLRRRWGGGILGIKSRHRLEKKEKAAAQEAAKKAGL